MCKLPNILSGFEVIFCPFAWLLKNTLPVVWLKTPSPPFTQWPPVISMLKIPAFTVASLLMVKSPLTKWAPSIDLIPDPLYIKLLKSEAEMVWFMPSNVIEPVILLVKAVPITQLPATVWLKPPSTKTGVLATLEKLPATVKLPVAFLLPFPLSSTLPYVTPGIL